MNREGLLWVHLSDLHFGHGDAAHHADQRGVLEDLLRDLKTMAEKLGVPDWVLVTGDIAFSGQAQEYDQALEWFGRLKNILPGTQIYLVPGNHDVDRRILKKRSQAAIYRDVLQDPRALDEYLREEESRDLLTQKLASYHTFASKLTCQPVRHPSITQFESALGLVEIVAINTVLASGSQDAKGQLAVGATQISALAQRPIEHLHLVLQHHPHSWLTDTDGHDLKARIQQRPHLWLVGHLHDPDIEAYRASGGRSALILAAGASHHEQGASRDHHYAWGSLTREGLAYYPRVWSTKHAAFRANHDASLDSEEREFRAVNELPMLLANWLNPNLSTPKVQRSPRPELLFSVAIESTDDSLTRARQSLQQDRPEEAQTLYQKELTRLEPLKNSPEFSSLYTRASLGLAACQIVLGQPDAGRARLLSLDLAALDAPRKDGAIHLLYQVDASAAEERLARFGSEDLPFSRAYAALLAGEIAPHYPEVPLELNAVTVLCQRGDYQATEQRLRPLLSQELSQELKNSWRISAVELAVQALGGTIWDQPPLQQPISVSDRAPLIDAIERQLSRPEPASEALSARLIQIKQQFLELTYDPDQDLDNRPELALEAVAPHPWGRTLETLQDQMQEDLSDELLTSLRALNQKFPDRAPILATLADYLRQRAHTRPEFWPEAEACARQAQKLLPGRGCRFLLGIIFAEQKKYSEAWALLQPLATGATPQTLRRIAEVALRTNPSEAAGLWERYRQDRPDDIHAMLLHAWTLWRLAENDAARNILTAIPPEKLSNDGLYVAGRLLARAPTYQDRYTAIVDELASRQSRLGGTQSNDAPGRYLWELRQETGDIDALDLDEALNRGWVWAATPETAALYLGHHAQVIQTALNAYQKGYLSFESCARLRGLFEAQWIQQALGPASKSLPLETPLWNLKDKLPKGQEILLGTLELHLLHAAHLLPAFRNWLNQGDRKLLLFQDDLNKLNHEFLQLSQPRFRYDQQLLLKIRVGWTQARASSQAIAPGSYRGSNFLGLAQQQGLISAAQAGRLRDKLRADTPLTLDLYLLRLLAAEDCLAALNVEPPLPEDPDLDQHLNAWEEQVLGVIAAGDRAEAIHQWVARGTKDRWIQALDRPEGNYLPPPGKSPWPNYYHDFKRALTWAESLHHHPHCVWVAADYFSASLFAGAVILPEGVLWGASGDRIAAYREVSRRVREVEDRCGRLGSLVRLLRKSVASTEVLAQLGVRDVFGRGDWGELAEAYGDLNQNQPQRYLDHLEAPLAIVAHPPHADFGMSPILLARRYAAEVIYLFEHHSPHWVAVAHCFLERLKNLPGVQENRSLSWFFDFLVAETMSLPRQAFDDDDKFSPQAPVAKLWQFLFDWAEQNLSHRGPFDRAIYLSWRWANFSWTSNPRAAPLIQALNTRARGSVEQIFVESRFESAAILSALHDKKLLESFVVNGTWNLEAQLQKSAQEIAPRQVKIFPSNDSTQFYIQGPNLPGGNFWVPMEALLLRIPLTTPELGEIVRSYAVHIGPVDGVLYQRALAWADAPHDPAPRQSFAERAVDTPARLVRHDPLSLFDWLLLDHDNPIGRPIRALADLRALLSEPETPLGDNIGEDLVQRAMPDGYWRQRIDFYALIGAATAQPNLLAMLPFNNWLNDAQFSRWVGPMLDRLEEPSLYSSGEVVQAILFLRAAALRQPHLVLETGEQVDLNQRLVDLLPQVVKEADRPPEGSLAEYEPFLLRICARAVHNLQDPAEPLATRDYYWLTWRLHGWYCARIRALPPELRSSLNRALRQLNIPLRPAEVAPVDLFDPQRFARGRLNPRLYGVLGALTSMDVVAHTVTPEFDAVLDTPSSPALEQILVELAGREDNVEEKALLSQYLDDQTLTQLGWHDQPTPRRLALKALILLNGGRITEINPEHRMGLFSEVLKKTSRKDDEAVALATAVALALNAEAWTPVERANLAPIQVPEGQHAWAIQILLVLASSGGVPDSTQLQACLRLLQAHAEDVLAPPINASVWRGYLQTSAEAVAGLEDFVGEFPPHLEFRFLTQVVGLIAEVPERAEALRSLLRRRFAVLTVQVPEAVEFAMQHGIRYNTENGL